MIPIHAVLGFCRSQRRWSLQD